MKRMLFITTALFFMSALYGCQPENETLPSGIGSLEPKDSGNVFPEFLAGTWEADKARWILTFEPDGSISSFRHYVGMDINVSEGGLREEWRNNIIASYVLKTCEAVYIPETRRLEVTVIIDPFNVSTVNDELIGTFVDYLKGPISKDGKKWKVSWLSYGTIVGAKQPDPNTIKPKVLTFTKTKGKNQASVQ